MSELTIILAASEDRTDLRETAEAAVSAASALRVEAELLVPAVEKEGEILRKKLHGLACRLPSLAGGSPS